MKSRKFNMQELIMLNSAMDLYTKKFGNSENSENLKSISKDKKSNRRIARNKQPIQYRKCDIRRYHYERYRSYGSSNLEGR